MSIGDWVVLVFGIINGLGGLYFPWRQNKIFERQNEIFATQAGLSQMPREPHGVSIRRFWPMFAMTALTLVTWSGVGYDLYDRHSNPDLPEFDVKSHVPFYAWGVNAAPRQCYVVIDGPELSRYKDAYRVAPACFYYDGSTDVLDISNLQVGATHDIPNGLLDMRINVSPIFAVGNVDRIRLLVLLIPLNVQISQFSTLRAARNLGVKIKGVGNVASGSR
jgi:hypothetical protein